MSHRVAKIVEWQDKALARHEDSIDEARLTLPITEALREHHVVLMPILANLHLICDIRATKIINRFFSQDNEQSKGEATAQISAWREIQKLIGNLIPKDGEDYFNDTRKRSIERTR